MAVAVAPQDESGPGACAPVAGLIDADVHASCRPHSKVDVAARDDFSSEEDGGSTRASSSPAASPDVSPDRRSQDGLEGTRFCTERLGQAEILSAIAQAVSHLVSLGNRPHKLTVFHSSAAPPITIQAYLKRLATHTRCTDECLVLAVVYIDRIMRLWPDFVVSAMNVHRLLATALTVAIKFHDDAMYSNRHYARCCGLQLRELNKLEAHFLRLSKWRLKVSLSEYHQYLQYAVGFGQDK